MIMFIIFELVSHANTLVEHAPCSWISRLGSGGWTGAGLPEFEKSSYKIIYFFYAIIIKMHQYAESLNDRLSKIFLFFLYNYPLHPYLINYTM